MKRRKYDVNSKVRAILTVRSIRSVISSMTGRFLKLDNGLEFMPNDRYLLENRKFRLYYTSLCDEAQNFIVVVEDNWGKHDRNGI